MGKLLQPQSKFANCHDTELGEPMLVTDETVEFEK
jgi:hypothetical protein